MGKKRRQFYQSVTMAVEGGGECSQAGRTDELVQFDQSVTMAVEDGEESNPEAEADPTIKTGTESAEKFKEVSSVRERSGQSQPADNGDVPKECDQASSTEDRATGGVAEE